MLAVGQWQQGDLDILVVLDAGYDAPRIAHLLGDLPVEILGRMRSDRVLRRPVPPRTPGTNGRPPKHGGEFVFGDSSTWGSEQAVTTADTRLYGMATAQAWDRLHPRLTRRAAWTDHEGPLPVIAGTVIRLKVDHLPSGGDPKPVWLWWSKVDASEPDVDRCWQSFLRRFDIEHTFRLFKQTLGWTVPKVRDPQAADSWTWLMIVVHTQLRLARPLTTDLRRPWEKPVAPDRLTPARVSEPPCENPLSGGCTETVPTRSRTTTWLEESEARTTSRRGTCPRHRRGIQAPDPPQEGHQATPNRLKIKVTGCSRSRPACGLPERGLRESTSDRYLRVPRRERRRVRRRGGGQPRCRP